MHDSAPRSGLINDQICDDCEQGAPQDARRPRIYGWYVRLATLECEGALAQPRADPERWLSALERIEQGRRSMNVSASYASEA